jgi:hypothetical protein
MKQLHSLMKKAEDSAFSLWLLNQVLWRGIPFNHPHKFKILNTGKDTVNIKMPYRKSNLNHIKGLHACGLATVCEYASGFLLIKKMGVKEYRIIMQKMEMEYFYQGKSDAFVEFEIKDAFIEQEIKTPLKNQDSIVLPFKVEVIDSQKNHLCTGTVYWQFKSWDKVKTKV